MAPKQLIPADALHMPLNPSVLGHWFHAPAWARERKSRSGIPVSDDGEKNNNQSLAPRDHQCGSRSGVAVIL